MQVVAYPLPESEVVATLDLGRFCDARTQGHAFSPNGRGEDGHLLRDPGAWADEYHIAQQDVDEFGQFVQGGATQQGTKEGSALFVRQWEAFCVSDVFHCVEFDDVRGLEVAGNAFLKKKGRRPLNDDQQADQAE